MQNNISTRIYHGNIKAVDLARALKSEFHRGNFMVQTFGKPNKIVLQITTQRALRSGGQTALTVNLSDVDDGVMVSVDKQKWLGVAASMGVTAISTVLNPLNLLSRLDDLAQDIESLQIVDNVWSVIDNRARLAGGAPLGEVQPITCRFCGFVTSAADRYQYCPNCKNPLG
jgi:predicted Zn-ribbon and HTH transcriptional regulator